MNKNEAPESAQAKAAQKRLPVLKFALFLSLLTFVILQVASEPQKKLHRGWFENNETRSFRGRPIPIQLFPPTENFLAASQKWKADLGPNVTPQLTQFRGLVFVAGKKVKAIRNGAGQEQWCLEDLATKHKAALLSINNNRLFISSPKGQLLCVDAVAGEVFWRASIAIGNPVQPMIFDKSRCYSAIDKTIQAFEIDSGKELWSFTTNGCIHLKPVISNASLLVPTVMDLQPGRQWGEVYSINCSSGHLNWRVKVIGRPFSSLVVDSNAVYFSVTEGQCLAEYGGRARMHWAAIHEVPELAKSPELEKITILYHYPEPYTKIVGLDINSGKEVFKFTQGRKSDGGGAPCIVGGRLCWRDYMSSFHAFNLASGIEEWRASLDGASWFWSMAVESRVNSLQTFHYERRIKFIKKLTKVPEDMDIVVSADTLYMGSMCGRILALDGSRVCPPVPYFADKTCREPKELFQAGDSISTPLTLHKGKLYFAAGQTLIYCISASTKGKGYWQFKTASPVVSLLVGKNERVCALTEDGTLYGLAAP